MRVLTVFRFHADTVLGLRDEGLFRRSPNSVLLKQAAQAYDRGMLAPKPSFHIRAEALTTLMGRARRVAGDVRRPTPGRSAPEKVPTRPPGAPLS